MPAYARVIPDQEDWHIETSETAGLQAPLRSINKDRLVAAAFSLGKALGANSVTGYCWVNFCRWTRNDQHGMEEHVDETFQLAFSRFGVAVMRDWEQIFTPLSVDPTGRPVLIYDYDAYCYRFCDEIHFLPRAQAWTVFSDIFGTTAPPIAEPVSEGEFLLLSDYMGLHLPDGYDQDGYPIRPTFHN